jgi:hypothetical protein
VSIVNWIGTWKLKGTHMGIYVNVDEKIKIKKGR